MFKKILIGFMAVLSLSQTINAQDINTLLSSLAVKDDLSAHTKKENAGYLIVFTRQDLDRMKTRSLKELINKIPFMRYNEDSRGLSAPYFQPYQSNNPSRVRVYINNREVLSPIFGNGLQILGQIDLAYIDHVEVYIGLPSYEISIEPAAMVIKAYTKTGKRENTSVLGVSGGSYGTSDTYGYTAKDMDDFSYFVYGNHRNLKREKLYNEGSLLSRDKDTNDFYAQLTTAVSRFELQAIKGNMDNFIANSWNMTPKDSDTDFTYLYAGYNFTSPDKSLKVNINYSYATYDYFDSSNSPLGLNPIAVYPFYAPFYTNRIKMHEYMLDTQITKKLNFDKSSLLFGLRNRYKKFISDMRTRDGVEVPLGSSCNYENIISVYEEFDYMLNEKNRLIFSSSVDKYYEGGGVSGETIYGVRLGHIYHNSGYTQKSFLFYGKFRPTPYQLLINDSLPFASVDLESEKSYAISTKSIWKYNALTTSLLFARTVLDKFIYYDPTRGSYQNSSDKYTFDSVSYKNSYALNVSDKVEFNAWISFEDFGKNSIDRYETKYGGYIALFKKFGKIDTYNAITYRDGYDNLSAGWNYDLTLSYPYSKHLSLFVKGENLFKDALKTNYYRLNPLTTQVTTLSNVSVYDRTVWLGMEYEF